MLNHVELQGKIGEIRAVDNGLNNEVEIQLLHRRGFSNTIFKIPCIAAGKPEFFENYKGRTVIVNGNIREKAGRVTIWCSDVHFVDGG